VLHELLYELGINVAGTSDDDKKYRAEDIPKAMLLI
jgi:hypothetical protein